MNLGKETDDAVSPVVGVMLMVVVTVVIAAVIVAFSSGLAADGVGSTPIVKFDIGKITLKQGAYDVKLDSIEFIHEGGDTLLLDDIEITMVGNLQVITNYFTCSTNLNSYGSFKPAVTVFGEYKLGTTVGPGDIIKVTVPSSSENYAYYAYEEVTWSLHDKRTDSVIANGVFTVPPEEI